MIRLENVSLSYPLLDIGSHSLQVTLREKIHKKISSLVGGNIGTSRSTAYVNALNKISLAIQDGQRVGLIGHNGAGKTTLLRLISGIYTPTQGKITVQGNIHALIDITLGMDPDVSGIKNIIFRLVFMGLTLVQAKKAIDEIVDFSGLAEFIHLPVRTYSTGMFLRLAFAISTHIPPDILILDEIIGAGDEAFKGKVLRRLDYLFTQSRIVVLSSHDMGLVKKYCNTAILMNKGNIVANGRTDEVVSLYLAGEKALSANQAEMVV